MVWSLGCRSRKSTWQNWDLVRTWVFKRKREAGKGVVGWGSSCRESVVTGVLSSVERRPLVLMYNHGRYHYINKNSVIIDSTPSPSPTFHPTFTVLLSSSQDCAFFERVWVGVLAYLLSEKERLGLGAVGAGRGETHKREAVWCKVQTRIM